MSKRNTSLDDFIKVIQFKIISTIRKFWAVKDSTDKSPFAALNVFKADWYFQKKHKYNEADKKAANKIYCRIVKNFHVNHSILVNIAGRDENGHKKLGAFLQQLTKGNPKLVYVHKKTAVYRKSGKKFTNDSWFYIPFEELEHLFELAGRIGNDPFCVNSTSEYYTELQHELIDKYIFNFHKDKDRKYTKSEKFDEYQARREAAKKLREANKEQSNPKDNTVG